MSRRGRTWDIIIFGATGFTGALIAEYLCDTYGVNQEVRWAVSGRNHQKLLQLRERLTQNYPDAASLSLLEADATQPDSLDRLAESAEVICSTVGPYLRYGAELVAACVRHQTDYCDLSGEVPFIRQMIDAHHEQAQSDGTRIIHACGYDSIPSDLGVLLVQRAFQSQFGRSATEVRTLIGPTRGGFSGGTLASMIGVLEQVKDPKQRRIVGNPYALNPRDGVRGQDGSDLRHAQFDDQSQKWIAPFVMSAINTRVVRRSHALLGYPYGRDFRYTEAVGFRSGLKGMCQAKVTALGLTIMVGLMMFRPTRGLLNRTLLPQPGEGPDRRAREQGYFMMRLLASDGDDQCRASVGDSLDPGYGSTAKMLAESAVILATQRDSLPQTSGVLTPAVGLGLPLIERLRDVGMTWRVDSQV